jgi:hypothetical protein
MRIAIALFGALVASMAALVYGATPPRDAYACSFGVPNFESLRDQASMIMLVNVTTAGGPINSQPPLITATPSATSSATPNGATLTPAPSPSPAAPLRTERGDPYTDLTGVGAEGIVLETYKGLPSSPITIDSRTRLDFERAIREYEARPPGAIPPPCPPGVGVSRYARHWYVVFATGSGANAETMFLGQYEAVLSSSVGLGHGMGLYVKIASLSMSVETYDTYLRGVVDAEIANDIAYVSNAVIPIWKFEPMLRGEPPPAAPPIVPPTTGSAGLKR